MRPAQRSPRAPSPAWLAIGMTICVAACGKPHAATGQDATGSQNPDASGVDAADAGTDASADAGVACTTAGSIDLSFGTAGTTIVSRGQRSIASAVIIDPTTSNIIVGGSTGDPDGNDEFTVVRLLPNGMFDLSFGMQGIARFAISGTDCWLEDVALQSDGKIVGVGGSNGSTAQLVVIRLLADGTLDPTFGSNGMVVSQPSILGHGVAIGVDSAQRIVVAAESWDDPTSSSAPTHFTTARYLASGILDSSFGTGGVAAPAFGGHDLANDMVLQSDDRIIVGGRVDMDQKASFGAARYSTDGSLDPTFGAGGTTRVSFSVGAGAQGLALGLSGSVLLAGDANDSMIGNCGAATRLLSDGTLDAGFATDGELTKCAGQNGISIEKTAVSPVDGKMLMVGHVAFAGAGGGGDLLLSRVDSAGAFDSSLATNGIVQWSAGTLWTTGWNLAVQNDGRIVVVGERGDVSTFDFMVARFCP